MVGQMWQPRKGQITRHGFSAAGTRR